MKQLTRITVAPAVGEYLGHHSKVTVQDELDRIIHHEIALDAPAGIARAYDMRRALGGAPAIIIRTEGQEVTI